MAMVRRTAAVTLEDVARASGYSRATVSRVVNGQANVDPAIAAAVQRAIKRTGYAANSAARTLAGGASHNVGLVFVEGFRELFRNPYWGEVVEGIAHTLGAHGYRASFLVRDEGRQLDTALVQRAVDAVIVMSPGADDRLERRLSRSGIPTVVFGQAVDARRHASALIDEEAAGALAASVLQAAGRTHPVVITGRVDMQVSERRVAGFAAAWLGAPLATARQAVGDFTVEGGYRAMRELLRRNRAVDAVFACSDLMALGALQALHEAGRPVPDSVAVVGVDGTVLGEQAQPRLTSIGADLEALGRELGALTLEAIAGDPPRSALFTPRVVRRESA